MSAEDNLVIRCCARPSRITQAKSEGSDRPGVAVALIDEAELPRHVQRRFTVGYYRPNQSCFTMQGIDETTAAADLPTGAALRQSPLPAWLQSYRTLSATWLRPD